jgi:hypothetical protein
MSTNQLLTVNLVLPTAGNSGEEAVSFTRLLFGLTALALERFGAARENLSRDALPQSLSPCLAGVPVDPFDGQLLRLRQADSGYQFHIASRHATATSVGERNLKFQVVESTLP